MPLKLVPKRRRSNLLELEIHHFEALIQRIMEEEEGNGGERRRIRCWERDRDEVKKKKQDKKREGV